YAGRSMFLQRVLPSHVESWKLPSAQIPHLAFEDPEIKSRMPSLHDNDFVKDWATYYAWRKLDHESPVALRMDMVLTVYHLLTKVLGVVDTSKRATELRRKLNIHFVGAEKELNIVPLFSELALLIPNTDIVITFFGQASKKLHDIAAQNYPGSIATKSILFKYAAPASLGGSILRVKISGRADLYDAEDLNDRPDALIAENAGLFAYMTWQMVYKYAATAGIPWGVTEYHMTEVIHLELTNKINPRTPEEAREIMARMTQIQARGACVNPFMRPGVMETDGFIPRAYNGFVLRVC
ncbi:hypothetical protein B0H13DRAFT_1610250, partial [Mycena leptocephala]